MIASLNALSEIEYACLNKTLKLHQTVNDPDFSKQWGMAKIRIQEAWKKTRGSVSIPVVIIDTGIDMNHDDLQGQFWVNPGEDLNDNGAADSSDYNGIDDDENGYIDDLVGWDFVDAPNYPDGGDYLEQDNDPSDEHGHGTSVAGIIAAAANNEIGIAGVAPECKIVNLRAGTSLGLLEEDDVAAAIIYAVEMKFRIINMSFGDVLITPLLRDVIRYAYQNGVIMIVSSGNSGNDDIHYPSGLVETISVGATTQSDYRANFSSFGSSLDLVAPGNAIYTTSLGNEYGEISGTSASAPFVSGVVALLLSIYPEMSCEPVRNRLQQTSDDMGETGWDFEYGAGILRADVSLLDLGNATVKIFSPIQDQGFSFTETPVIATCAGPLVSGYELSIGEGLNPTNWTLLREEKNRQIISDTLIIWQVPASTDTIFTFRLCGFLSDGDQINDYVSVYVDHTAPVVKNFEVFPVISEKQKGYIYKFDTDDFTGAKIHFRFSPADDFQTENLKFQNIHHANFLFEPDQEAMEFYFEIRNRSGMTGFFPQSPPWQQINFEDSYDIFDFLQVTEKSFSPGYLLDYISDFDQDGNPEITMNQYENEIDFGDLVVWEFENDRFTRVKNTGYKLIPRDIADVNGDGILDLLAGAGEASLILTASPSDPFPNTIAWLDTNDVWASRLYDFDMDGYPELIAKQGNVWKIWQNNKDYSFSPVYELPNNTEGGNGTGVPHVEIGDFDGDERIEILFGDYDGDIYIYEISTNLLPIFEWSDRLPLMDAIDFLTTGDYDGDGRLEFAVGCHSADNIDLEHQFDERHWLFRIYDYGNGNYNNVWQQRIYPYYPPKDFDSGLSSGDINGDDKDDLFISVYPNLYLVSFDSVKTTFEISGSLNIVRSNSILLHDFDSDGKKDLLLNDGSQNRLYQYQGDIVEIPFPPANFEALALDSNTVLLTWDNFNEPDSFCVYRGIQKEQLDILALNWTEKSYLDSSVTVDQEYWYQISRIQIGSPEVYSQITSVIPHRPARLKLSKLFPPNQLLLQFSLAMSESANKAKNYLLKSFARNPETALLSQNLKDVLLTWPIDQPLPQNDSLILSNLSDSSGTPIDQRDLKLAVTFENVEGVKPYIVRAEFSDNKHLLVEFSQPMRQSELFVPANYSLEPNIPILSVRFVEASDRTVELEIAPDKPIGPVGFRYDLIVKNLFSESGIPLNQSIGFRLTFLFVANDLSKVYVYPNPVKSHLTFARLTKNAEIEIYNSSGILIRKLLVATIDGGFDWNLLDKDNLPIPSGIYIYRVFNDNESYWKKFAVVR